MGKSKAVISRGEDFQLRFAQRKSFMSYHIYHTRGIIVGSQPSGESNRFYKIFTEELGLVGATAQSVRVGKSKLRYVLQDYGMVLVDLVRGKEVWRITSAIEEQPPVGIDRNENKEIFTHACMLVSRLLHGEAPEKEIFIDLHNLADFLRKEGGLKDLRTSVEALFALRTLVALGYVDSSGYGAFLKAGEYTKGLLTQFSQILPRAVELVNNALASSHL